MEHVRLPLASKNYIDSKLVKEPLLNNCSKCKFSCNYASIVNEFIFYVFIIFKGKEYIDEALYFHFLKRNQADQVITIPECIRYKPRVGDKV